MLDTSNYTVSDALTYKMFYGHFKEAANSQGALGSRICHAGLAVLELFPCVVALVELAVVKIFGLAKDSCCKDLKDNKIEKPEDQVVDSDSIPAIPTRYALYALAFVVIAPIAIYAIASRFIPSELLAEPLNMTQNITDASSGPTLGGFFNTLYSYLPGAAEKLEGVATTLNSIPLQPIDIADAQPVASLMASQFDGASEFVAEGINIANPALSTLANASV